jgi:hypothetical protein
VQLGQFVLNKGQVDEALGEPEDVSENETENYVIADWFYRDVTLHFTNNELAAFTRHDVKNKTIIETPGDIYARP